MNSSSLGGKARRITLHPTGAALAVSNLGRRKDAVAETLAASREDFREPRNLYHINADGDDHLERVGATFCNQANKVACGIDYTSISIRSCASSVSGNAARASSYSGPTSA